MAATAVATTELEMVQDARHFLLANGGTPAELERNQQMIDKYRAELGSPLPGGVFPVQRTGGPKKLRLPDMAKPGQIDYATDLLRRLWGHDKETLAELVELLPTRTRPAISRQIDNLMSILASIPRGLNPELEAHLRDLWDRKMVLPGGGRDEELYRAFVAKLSTMTYGEGRKLADQLRALADGAAPEAVEITDGLYQTPDGVIFKVQIAVHGSGKLYAKQMTKLEIPRIVRGKEVTYEFTYVPGAVKRLRPEWKMTREEAAAWGKLYGSCCRCGITLTQESSIEQGMGDWCYGKM
jgi:uncharacterized protein DUF6011